MTYGNTKKILTISIIAVAIFFAVHNNVSAAFEYKLLEAFPGFFSKGSSPNLPDMILAIYKFGIWTVGICGLLMITVGGVMYMGSAGNNATAESAKRIITDSLIGIVAALGAYLFMYVINPDLTVIKLSLTTAKTSTSSATTDAASTAAGTEKETETAASIPETSTATTTTACSSIPSQNSSQCSAASSELQTLLSCIYGKLGNTIQVSSISDGNGGVNCYTDHPTWGQCTTSKTSNCCFHKKYSCHYGGKSCTGKSVAADFSDKGSAASNSQIIAAAKTCGASYTKNEDNHVHVSVGSSCGCN